MAALLHGDGPLFADPSADRARAFFAQKPRALSDKVVSVADAVRRLVHNGDYLAIGGFGSAPLPPAAGHGIARQGPQNLPPAGPPPTPDFRNPGADNTTRRGRTR